MPEAGFVTLLKIFSSRNTDLSESSSYLLYNNVASPTNRLATAPHSHLSKIGIRAAVWS